MNLPAVSRLLLVLTGFLLLTFAAGAGAEPPSRAARLGFISGNVSFSPAGEEDWLRAGLNRPLTNGDRLWVEEGARAELQIGGASIRLGGGTSLTLLNLDDRIVQLQLTEGRLNVRVFRMGRSQAFEVNTPNLAFSMNSPGQYRIDVNANDDATSVLVRSGRGEAYGERSSYALNAGQGYRFYGTGLSDYDRPASRDDDLDRWAIERDRRYERSVSARYVSSDVVGYDDLDSYGAWRRDPTYGNVWAPNRVAAGWTPYRDGHWAWVDPWGWTWVDDQPWGYAVSHYGRWARIRGQWCWVPGPRTEPAVYAPALVAFIGGQNAQLSFSVGGVNLVAWFPLAPREVYEPSYQVSRGYFERINRSNSAVAPTVINNYYTTVVVNRDREPRNRQAYANQREQGAVVAVPPQSFQQSQPVARSARPVTPQQAASAPAQPVAAVPPEKQSVQGGAPAADQKPRGRDRRVIARTAPPAPPPAFAAQQPALAATPGRPVDDTQRGRMKPAPAAAAPLPAVVTAVTAPATAPPPAVAPAPRSPDQRRADANRRDGGDARGEGRRGDAAKADAGKGEAAKAEAAKAEAAKTDAARAEAAKGEAAKAEAARAAAAKADATRADAAAKAESARAEAMKADASRRDAAKAEAAKADAAAKAAAANADAARAEAAKADAGRKDAARAEAAKGDAAKADAAKADAARADAAKAEGARRDAARAEAAKGDAARAEAAKAEGARREAARAEAARADAARAEAARGEAAKAEAGRAAQAKAAGDKAAADRAAGEAQRAAAGKAEAARAEAGRAEAAKAEAAKAAQERAAGEAARAAQAKAAADKAAADRAAGEAARAQAAQAEAAKAAQAKAAQDRAAAEAARAQAAQAEAARAAQAKAAADKAAQDRAAAEAARAAQAQAQAKAAADKAAAEKAAAAKAAAEKAAAEKGAADAAAKAAAKSG